MKPSFMSAFTHRSTVPIGNRRSEATRSSDVHALFRLTFCSTRVFVVSFITSPVREYLGSIRLLRVMRLLAYQQVSTSTAA